MILQPHPNLPAAPTIEIDAIATRRGPVHLDLRFVVTGDLDALYLPPAGHPTRADELWKRTCFEAFVRPGTEESYFEFNFAPTRWWATYRFDRYREGMTDAAITPALVEAHTHGERFELTVALDLPDWTAEQPWRLGLTTVIEDLHGEKSYWALAHPPGKPDFHHPDSFACDLSPAEPA